MQLATATTSITVTDGLASRIPTNSYTASYEVASSSGQVGAPASVTNTVQPATTNRPPTVTAVTASPNIGLQASTTIAFSVQASDPDNDPLTFAWTFGDGGTSTGPAPTHIYQTSGTFTTAVAVSDGHVTVTNQTTVSVVGLTGTWGPSCAGGCPTESGLYFTLAQSGSTITGSYFSFLASVDCCAAAFALSGSVNMASPHVTVEATYAPPRLPTCWFLEPNADVSVLSGVLGSCNNPIAPSQAFARTNVIPHPSQ